MFINGNMGGKFSRQARLQRSRPIDNNLHSYDGLVLPEGWVIHRLSVFNETLATIAYYGMEIRCHVSRRGDILYELPVADYSCGVLVVDVDLVAVYSRDLVRVYRGDRLQYRFLADTLAGIWRGPGVIYTSQYQYELGETITVRRHRRARPPVVHDLVVVFSEERTEPSKQYLGELQLLHADVRESIDEPELITVSASNHALFVKKVFSFRSASRQHCLDVDIDDTIYMSLCSNKVLQLI